MSEVSIELVVKIIEPLEDPIKKEGINACDKEALEKLVIQYDGKELIIQQEITPKLIF